MLLEIFVEGFSSARLKMGFLDSNCSLSLCEFMEQNYDALTLNFVIYTCITIILRGEMYQVLRYAILVILSFSN